MVFVTLAGRRAAEPGEKRPELPKRDFSPGKAEKWGSGRGVHTTDSAGVHNLGAELQGQASDPAAFPKRSELAGSAVEPILRFVGRVVKPGTTVNILIAKRNVN